MGQYKFRDGTELSAENLEVRDRVRVDSTGVGGAFSIRQYDSGVVDVATDGAATTLTLGIPDGSVILGFAVQVEDEITGIDGDTGTFAFIGGSTLTFRTISAFTSGTGGTGAISGTTDGTVSGDPANATFTISGGADNTPDGGSVRAVVTAMTITALD